MSQPIQPNPPNANLFEVLVEPMAYLAECQKPAVRTSKNKIRIVGRYFGLLKFLQGLQDGERLAVVKNLSIVSKGDTLESDMLIYIYAVPAK